MKKEKAASIAIEDIANMMIEILIISNDFMYPFMTTEPENTGRNQDGTFAKGQSGNPNGRPKGSLNNSTKIAITLFENEIEGIARTAISMALNGDIQAIKLILERIVPPRKERFIDLSLPAIKNAQDILSVNKYVVGAVTNGELTTSEGHNIMAILENLRKTIETEELEQRINMLEENHEKR